MTTDLVLPDPHKNTLPSIRSMCRAIYERRDEVIGALDVDQAETYRRQANAIEQFIGNREGRDDARRAARILECAVGAALGESRLGANQWQGSLASEGSQISADDRYRFRQMYQFRDVWEPVLTNRGLSRAQVLALIKLNQIGSQEAAVLDELYDVLVIDPPWEMTKIGRDVRPNQAEGLSDYPVMSEDELSAMTLPMMADCHVWVWTTHRFLPMAFRLLDAWGLKYVCTFVWHKAGGFQPVGLPQFNCEFALYARHGVPQFIDTKAFPTCFHGTRGRHSEKPSEFYDLVLRVTTGRRLDMFNRRQIEGFQGWGKETIPDGCVSE